MVGRSYSLEYASLDGESPRAGTREDEALLGGYCRHLVKASKQRSSYYIQMHQSHFVRMLQDSRHYQRNIEREFPLTELLCRTYEIQFRKFVMDLATVHYTRELGQKIQRTFMVNVLSPL